MPPICQLPPQIVDQILGFDDTSHLSLTLWLVGNKRFNELLAQSVTYVELRNEKRLDFCVMPLYLSNLVSLRHLIVNRGMTCLAPRRAPEARFYHHLHDRKRSASVISSLPSTMETLILRFHRSNDIFFLTGTENAGVSLKTTFPSLQRLHIDLNDLWSPSWLLELPLTITNLCITLSALGNATSTLKLLPGSLLHLGIHISDRPNLVVQPQRHPFDDLIAHLPSRLESLLIVCKANLPPPQAAALTQLPRSLFACNFQVLYKYPRGKANIKNVLTNDDQGICLDQNVTPEMIEAVPPFVSSLVTVYYLPKLPVAPLFEKMSDHVASLSLAANLTLDPKSVRALPRHLTYLRSAIQDLQDCKGADFPPNLQQLRVLCLKGAIKLCHHFPSSLTTLVCLGPLKCKELAKLPRTITNLNIELADLPGESQRLFLPDGLKSFVLRGGTNVLSTLSIIQNGKTKPFKAKDARTPMPTPNMAFASQTFQLAWLPRNLALLEIEGFHIPISALIYLPRHLTHLSIDMLFHDTLYDPSSEAALEKAKEMHQGFEADSGLWSENPQVTMLDWLPRSLRHLSIGGHMPVPTTAWSRLPPGIESLELNFPPMDHLFLRHLPKTYLRRIAVNLDVLDDDDLACLPKRLETFMFSAPRQALFLTECDLQITAKFAGTSTLHVWRSVHGPVQAIHHDRLENFEIEAGVDNFEAIRKGLENPSLFDH